VRIKGLLGSFVAILELVEMGYSHSQNGP